MLLVLGHRKRLIFFIVPMAIGVGLAACGEAQQPAAQVPLPVLTQQAVVGRQYAKVALTGDIRARIQSDLSFRTAGRVASRLVDIGDHVSAGQVLATLETAEQAADVNAAKAGVHAAEATLRQAASTLDRQKVLIGEGFTTRAHFDNASQAFIAAQSSLVSAKSALAIAQEQLGYASLRADATGVITARNVEAGQIVAVAQPIFTVALDGARDAVFDIYETLLTRRPATETITIALLSNPAITANGKVRETSPTINPLTGTIRVKVGIDEPPGEFGLGAAISGMGRFQTDDVVALPWTAFFTQGDAPAVWIVDPQSHVVSLRAITVEGYRSGEMLVRGGLKSGDLVVTNGAQLLRPGQKVAPQPATGQPGAAR